MGGKPTKTRIVLVGRAGAGKDYNARKLADAGYKVGLSHTTREMREGEEHLVDYFFVDNETFDSIPFYESAQHGLSRYGLSLQQWEENNVFVMNPAGIQNIVACGDRETTFVIFIDTPENVRNVRLAERGWTDQKISDRSQVDDLAFQDFENYDLRVDDPEHDVLDLVGGIVSP